MITTVGQNYEMMYIKIFRDAIIAGDLTIVKGLLVMVDINYQTEIGRTFLYFAAVCGKTEIAKYLIDCGASIDIADRYGYTALHKASDMGEIEIVRYMLDHGADFDTKDMLKRSPLDDAKRSGYQEIVALLEKAMHPEHA